MRIYVLKTQPLNLLQVSLVKVTRKSLSASKKQQTRCGNDSARLME